MAERLQVTKAHRDDLLTIVGIGSEQFRQVSEDLRARNTALFTRDELQGVLEERLEPSQAQVLSKHLVGLAAVGRDKELQGSEIIESLTESLKDSGWTSEELHNWNEVAPFLSALLASDAVCILTKILDLTYDYTNIIDRTRIVTDIRPIFDEGKTEIQGGIITQNLRIHYFGEGGSQSITFALDAKDVALLRDSCDGALKKAKEAKRLFSEKYNLRSIVTGESEENGKD